MSISKGILMESESMAHVDSENNLFAIQLFRLLSEPFQLICWKEQTQFQIYPF